MAVVQISRIQVRRGQKNVTGIPQLASGEFGWAVDTRELYIGNGSVSEGAPQVGNTKILTEFDNLFSVADSYTYKVSDGSISTGPTVESPIRRTLQERLDDRVSVRSFGLTGDPFQNATSGLQNAIDQLFLNDASKTTPGSRVVLYMEPGEYVIEDSIYIPPFTTIVGAGKQKTVIRSNTVDKPLFITVNSSSTPGSPADDSSSTFLNQARNIHLSGITLESTVTNDILVLNSCRESEFNDLEIKGSWISGDTISSSDVGIKINMLSGSVSSKGNIFTNISIKNLSYGISTDWDIINNHFVDMKFDTCGYGIGFGTGIESLNINAGSGTETGPLNNVIENSLFENIDKNAFWIKFGTNNISQNNKFYFCGNDGGEEYQNVTSVMKFDTRGNTSLNDFFNKSKLLSYNNLYWDSFVYLPEIEGNVVAEFAEVHSVTINRSGTDINGPIAEKIFRLSAEQDVANQQYEIQYLINSLNFSAFRSGTLTLSTNGFDKTITISDQYDYAGDSVYEDAIGFSAVLQDVDSDTDDDTIDVLGTSTMPSADTSVIEFKIKLRKTSIDAAGE